MALIAVLWITSLLALMAAGIGSSGRMSTRLAFNTVESTRARMLADAGVQQAVFDLLTTDVDRPWQVGGTLDFAFMLGDERVSVQVRDEDGKIDLNAAPLELLQGLFRAIGLGEELAISLASRVGDFRDEDSVPEPSGAEDAEYEAAGRPDGAADRAFRRIEELVEVLGVTDAIYERVRRHVTIYSDAEGMDLFRASSTVLKALPGMTQEAEALILSNAQAEDLVLDLPDTVMEPFEDYLLPSRDLIFEIRALGESGGGGRFVREAIVALDGGRDSLPFTTYAWRRGAMTPTEPQ